MQSGNSKIAGSFLAVILIWSTTPLAIKWSAEGAGFQFALSSRMILGAAVATLITLSLRQRLPWNRVAVRIYLTAAVSVFGSMQLVYWGAVFIPSGLIAVIFGFAPMLTSLLASRFTGEAPPTVLQWGGLVISLVGLVVIFARGIVLESIAVEGVIAVILSVVLHSVSAVAVKAQKHSLSALVVTTGALLVSLPMFIVTGWLSGVQWPASADTKTVVSIIYLGLMGSVLGFILYYYLIEKLKASTVALITLITPVTALIIGRLFNNETIGLPLALGVVLVMTGLMLYQWRALKR